MGDEILTNMDDLERNDNSSTETSSKRNNPQSTITSKKSMNTLTKITSAISLRFSSTELIAATQLGLYFSLGRLAHVPADRDVLMNDFFQINIYYFPSTGSSRYSTPSHNYVNFKFKDFAPVAFRYFRKFFGIKPEDFLNSLCKETLKEISSSGASGSMFYKSSDDLYVIKTVDQREAKFLQRLLPGYYLNLEQNKSTLLPKFFGLYNYSSLTQDLRFVIMNNLLPSGVVFSEIFDIKGSTYKRRAKTKELSKALPVFKDLDFLERYPSGLFLEPELHQLLMKTLERDARVLCSFKIMDYSLLMGISKDGIGGTDMAISEQKHLDTLTEQRELLSRDLRGLKIEQEHTSQLTSFGGLPARNLRGERLVIYVGIIDILQNYRFKKKMEYRFKSIIRDGSTISVNEPRYYQGRFLDFCREKLFKLAPNARRPTTVLANENLHRLNATEFHKKKLSDSNQGAKKT